MSVYNWVSTHEASVSVRYQNRGTVISYSHKDTGFIISYVTSQHLIKMILLKSVWQNDFFFKKKTRIKQKKSKRNLLI